MNIKTVIDKIVWFIPSKKLRNLVRNILYNLSELDTLLNKCSDIELSINYNNFFLHSKKDRVLLVEFCNYHGEVLLGMIKYLLDLGYKVDVLTVIEQKRQNSLTCFYDDINVNICYTSIKNILSILLDESSKIYKSIIFNTQYDIIDKYYKELKENNNKIYIIYHDIRLLDYKLIGYDNIIVLRSFNNEKTKNKYVNPHYFGNVVLNKKNENIIKFLITGINITKEHNVNMIINTIRYLKSKSYKNFLFIIISRYPLDKRLKKFKKYISYKNNVGYDILYEEIKKSDYILPMLDYNNNDEYTKYISSGSFQLIYGFIKLGIIERKIAAYYDLNENNSLLYDNAEEFKYSISKAVDMTDEEYKIKQNNLKLYSDILYKESLDNLKNIICD